MSAEAVLGSREHWVATVRLGVDFDDDTSNAAGLDTLSCVHKSDCSSRSLRIFYKNTRIIFIFFRKHNHENTPIQLRSALPFLPVSFFFVINPMCSTRVSLSHCPPAC